MIDRIEGTLHKNDTGRFELDDHEFTSGSSIQVYHPESGFWLVGRVEYAKTLGGYYFYSNYPYIKSFPLREGMKARVGYPKDHVAPWMIDGVLDGIGSDLRNAVRDKEAYPDHYKETALAAVSRLTEFLKEIDGLPCLDT